MKEDPIEGFLYPMINHSMCISCNRCESVCPSINLKSPKYPLKTYVAINPNEEKRRASSSGGIFALLAEHIIRENGVVFGASFDNNWTVLHSYTESLEGLSAYRGSKYVQSQIGQCYKQVKGFLKSGRLVLFSGTPCQISGLILYLGRNYDNLVTVDFICHGVPSPKIFKWYLENEIKNARRAKKRRSTVLPFLKAKPVIRGIEFRNKEYGWKKFCFVLKFAESKSSTVLSDISSYHFENNYMKVFLNDLILRPSCYSCPVKEGKSGSDITLADCWGIENFMHDFDDDKGTSLLMVNTDVGQSLLKSLDILYKPVDFNIAISSNKSWSTSARQHVNRDEFFQKYRFFPSSFGDFVNYVPEMPWKRRCKKFFNMLRLR